MLRILIIFLVLIGGLFIGPQIAGNQGIAFFQVAGYRVKMAFNTFLVLELLCLLLLYIIYWLLKKVFYSKTALGNWLRAKAPRKAAKQIEQAQLFLLEGDYKKAGKLLSKSAKLTSDEALTYLQAAQAHINQNQLIEARKLLDKAALVCKDHEKFAFKLVQLRLQLKNKEYALAKITIDKLLEDKPRNPEVLRLAYQLNDEIHDYAAIIELLPVLYKAEVFEESQIDQFKSLAYIGKMQSIYDNEGIDELTKWWKAQPKGIRNTTLFEKAFSAYQQKTKLLVG